MTARRDEGACDSNRISVQSAADGIKTKSADAAEKVAADSQGGVMVMVMSCHSKDNSSTMQSTPEHQSANEQTLMRNGGGASPCLPTPKAAPKRNAGHAKTTEGRRKAIKSNKTSAVEGNCVTQLRNAVYEFNHGGANEERHASADSCESSPQNGNCGAQRAWRSPGEKKCHQMAPPPYQNAVSPPPSLNTAFYPRLNASIGAHPSFPGYPLTNFDALQQQQQQHNSIGDAMSARLREIDVRLYEMHSHKMYIDEIIVKMQKERMDIEVQAMKLQNEKFILLNAAMTTAATTSAMEGVALKSDHEEDNGSRGQSRKPNDRCASKEEDRRTAHVAKRSTKSPSKERTKRRRAEKPPEAGQADETVACNGQALAQAEESMESIEYRTIGSANFKGVQSPVMQIQIFEDFIYAATEDGHLYKFHQETYKMEDKVVLHSEAITAMFLCEAKQELYTVSLDGYLRNTRLEDFKRNVDPLYLREPLQSIDVQWGIGFVGTRWGNIYTYDVADHKLYEFVLCSLEDASIVAIKAIKDGDRKVLVVSSKGHLVQIRDAHSGLLIRTLDVPENLSIYSLLLDYQSVYCGSQQNEVYKFDLNTGAHLATLGCGNGAVAMCSYRNKFLLVGCYDGFIYVLNKDTGVPLGHFAGSGKIVLALQISGDRVVTSAKDKSVKVINIPFEILELIRNKYS